MDAGREQFGHQRLEETFAKAPRDSARAILDHVLAAIGAHVQQARRHDDTTLIVARIDPTAGGP